MASSEIKAPSEIEMLLQLPKWMRGKVSLTNEETENIPIKIKYDMGWQKRGSGRKYDSMSGVGVAIGNETGKVLEREIRSKNCRTCSYWEGKGTEAALHDCPRNWYGTSKGHGTGWISKYASEVTGLSMCNNILCYNGRKVNSCSPQQGLQNFIIWLQETIPEKCMLIGHNAKIFDAPRLVLCLQKF
ncbi:Hypothetical predicted protein [Mytilus galloprovincialis]|uniref:Mutator-like transposase domain-containing protein n=1 Tax=Mytilus galloprovincialis TaxID=29158 RepID=A0A8B6CK14_MYTGA|nr:Hypothetical predicted protein [Mytilus galloprovincialis]